MNGSLPTSMIRRRLSGQSADLDIGEIAARLGERPVWAQLDVPSSSSDRQECPKSFRRLPTTAGRSP